MSIHLTALIFGFTAFMLGVCWVVYYLLALANSEYPGCINPNRHK